MTAHNLFTGKRELIACFTTARHVEHAKQVGEMKLKNYVEHINYSQYTYTCTGNLTPPFIFTC